MTVRRRLVIAGLACAAGLATACRPPDHGPRFRAAGAARPRDGGTLRFAIPDQIRTLDPTVGFDEFTSLVLHPLFDTLVDFAPGSVEIVPRLAARWEISDAGLTYSFELRPGIAFADGAPIVAAHVKYGLERALTTPASPFGEFLADVAGAPELAAGKATDCAGIVADGDRRVVIHLSRQNPALLDILTMPFATPQRPDHVARAGAQLRRRPDATGPFELDSWDEGGRLVLRRSPRYHDPARVHLDAIELHENVPRDTQFQMFELGELDTAEKLAAPDLLFVMSEPAWQPYVHRTVGMNAFGSRFDVRVPPFSDRRVRQALNYALDKDHTAKLLNATAAPAHGILPPGMLGRDPDLAPYPHDVARARALLAEAGYPGGLDLEYVTTSDEETEKISASLQSDLAEAGVRVHIAVMSFATWQTAIAQPTGPAFSFIGWTADFPDPIDFFDPKFHSRSIKPADSSNDSFYANSEVDALLDAARAELDRDRRAALYRRVERILYDDAPWLWDYHRMVTEVVQPYVRGYAPHPIWMRDYTSAWLDLGPDGQAVPR
jgi:ABC-type transport system substrate-binding protein